MENNQRIVGKNGLFISVQVLVITALEEAIFNLAIPLYKIELILDICDRLNTFRQHFRYLCRLNFEFFWRT
jgi:hypothetical protein